MREITTTVIDWPRDQWFVIDVRSALSTGSSLVSQTPAGLINDGPVSGAVMCADLNKMLECHGTSQKLG